MLSLVLYQLPLAHDIALAGLTCRALCDAAKLAFKARPFSGEVVTLAGHTSHVWKVATAADDHIITGAFDSTVKVWRDGVCVRTIQAHTEAVRGVIVVLGGTRFVSGSIDHTVKLWTLEGGLERTFEMGGPVYCVAALPDGEHFVVGVGDGGLHLYHVDGRLVHRFKGQVNPLGGWDSPLSVMVTHDGQHIIGGTGDGLVNVWSVASKHLVSTCRGHTYMVWAVAEMPDGQRFLSGASDKTVCVWLLDGTHENTFRHLHTDTVCPRGAARQPARALRLDRQDHSALQRQRRRHPAHLQALVQPFVRRVLLALLPDGLRFVIGCERDAYIAYHGLAP